MTISLLKLGNAIDIERLNVDNLRTKINARHDSLLATLDTLHSIAANLTQMTATLRDEVKTMKYATDEELDNQHEALRVLVDGED